MRARSSISCASVLILAVALLLPSVWTEPGLSHGLATAADERQMGVVLPAARISRVGGQRIVIVGPQDLHGDTVEDTYLSEWNADTYYGEETSFRVRDFGDVLNALLRWNLDFIPLGSTIREARLELYCTYRTRTTESDLSVFKVLVPWDEYLANWKQASTGVLWDTPGCSTPGADRSSVAAAVLKIRPSDAIPGWVQWDLSALVQEWANDPGDNNGMALVVSASAGPSARFDFGSSEGYFSTRPRLVVDYVPSTETPTASATPTQTATPTATMTATPSTTVRPTTTASGTAIAAPTTTPTLSTLVTPTPITARVGGLVYEDHNGNAQHDEGEPGIGGVAVEFANSEGLVLALSRTKADGTVFFDASREGTYRVQEFDPPGMVSTTDNLVVVYLTADALLAVSFGDVYIATPTPTTPPTPSATPTGLWPRGFLPILQNVTGNP